MMNLKHNLGVILALSLTSSVSFGAFKKNQRYQINGNIFGQNITIGTSSQFAGAIDSVIWAGKEFINRDDHGRQLQSASSYDGFGECLNPTEAGSGPDGKKSTSSSKLLGISTENNILRTTTQMAYWTAPGQAYPAGCGNRPEFKKAQNTTIVSQDLLSKEVRIGWQGLENVLEYLVSFKVNEPHATATFEALTGYMTRDFSSFWTLDTATGLLNPLSVGPGEQSKVVILSTPDQKFAMGIYSPELPQPQWGDGGYGRFAFPGSNTMKWNAVFRQNNIAAGTYSFRLYVALGNLQQVQKSLMTTHHFFKGSDPINPPPPVVEKTIPVHRFYNSKTGEHFFTASHQEGAAAGYSYEGVGFKVFSTQSNGVTTPLYRCLKKNGFHFVSTSSNCEGTHVEGLYGFIKNQPSADSAALYRSYNSNSGDHLLTTNAVEAQQAPYRIEAVLGYSPN